MTYILLGMQNIAVNIISTKPNFDLYPSVNRREQTDYHAKKIRQIITANKYFDRKRRTSKSTKLPKFDAKIFIRIGLFH